MNNISVKVNFRNQETKTYDDVKMIFVNDTKLWLITDDCDNATILNKKTILGFEPIPRASKTLVLPLHHASSFSIRLHPHLYTRAITRIYKQRKKATAQPAIAI